MVCSEIVQELIGLKKFSEQIEATPPVKPEQFSWLLDKLEEKKLYELKLACGLIGYFGLRLAELAVIQVDGNEYPLVKLEISRTSHPYYTGKSKLVDTAGRIDKFKNKYSKFKKK